MASNAQRIQFLLAQEDGFNKYRLPALYSDFRGLRSTNPEGYAANVGAWRRGLAALVRGGMLPGGTSSSLSLSSSSSSSPLSARKSASLSTPLASAATADTTRNCLILTTGPALLDALQTDRYGRPLALDAAIHEAVQDRDLVPLPVFLQSRESIYSRASWFSVSALAVLPWQALTWGFHQLGGGDRSAVAGSPSSGPAKASEAAVLGKLPTELLVVLANVEAAAVAFVDKTADMRSRFDRTWSLTHFKRVFSQPGAVLDSAGVHFPPSMMSSPAPPRLTDADLDVLLTFLSRDRHVVAFDGKVVKLLGGSNGGSGAGVAGGACITDEDRAVAQLRELLDSLTHQTSVLSRRIDDLMVEAKDAVQRGNRVAALASIRLKKQTESVLTTRFATLAQLEATAARIEQASDQVQVVQVLAASADALQTLNGQVGGANRVEEVVGRLREQMDATDEMAQTLVLDKEDEDDLDEELAVMEKMANRERLEKQDKEYSDQQALAAEETKRRLDANHAAPSKIVDSQTVDKTGEDDVADSLRNLSLNAETA